MQNNTHRGLDEAFMQVREFHLTMGQPVADRPTMLTPERTDQRTEWGDEEAQEQRDATTLVDQLDAIMDRIYFALGDLVEMGIMPSVAFDIVHSRNVPGKLWPDGSVHKNELGKVMKPPGWVAPEPLLELEIQRQLKELPLALPATALPKSLPSTAATTN
jgi:predicted HAD superfamily Cof-like phosphohydrolase